MSDPGQQLRLLVDEMLFLFSETADFQSQGDPGVLAMLQEAKAIIMQMHRRLNRSAGEYVVALVGHAKVGKSTLINALLGVDLSPRFNSPCTAAAIEFRHGQIPRVSACRGEITLDCYPCDSVEQIREQLERLGSVDGEDRDDRVRYLVVELPNVPERLIFADTPGFGAAEVGGDGEAHTRNLNAYVSRRVSRAFWVVLAEQGIGKAEAKYFQGELLDKCGDVVVTGSDGWDEADRIRFKRRFAGQLRQHFLRFHFVDGLQALQAGQKGDGAALRSSGVPDLMREMSASSPAQDGTAEVIGNLQQLSSKVVRWWGDFAVRNPRAAQKGLWPIDSYGRFSGRLIGRGEYEKITAAICSPLLGIKPVDI